MKKIFLIFPVLLASTFAYCQSSRFGLKGGINYANIGGDSEGVESRIAFHGGLYYTIRPNDHFAIQPEVVFSRQGAAVSGNSDVRINYDYVNFPLMFNYYATETFFLQGGPQLGVVVGGKVTDGTNSGNLKDQLNSPDLALGIGFGFDLRSTTIGLRYNAGLSSTTDGLSADDKFPNQVLQVSLGFNFY